MTSHQVEGVLPLSTFLAVAWVFTGLAICLTAGRYFIRYRLSKFQSDDWAHGFALITLLVFTSCYSVLFPLSATVQRWASGQGPKPSDAYVMRFFHLDVGTEFVFWVVLYAVKFTFLVFYRNLFGISKPFMKAWWAVFGFTWVSFLACFLMPLWKCNTPSQLFVLKHCISKSASDTVDQYAETSVGFNIASDLAIMILPIWMLKTLQVPRSKKIGLAFLFSIGFFVILIEILRITMGVGGGSIKMAALWDLLEPCIAVIISALPTYSAVFVAPRKRAASSYKYNDNSNSGASKREYGKLSTQGKRTYTVSEDATTLKPGAPRSHASSATRTDGSLELQERPVDTTFGV